VSVTLTPLSFGGVPGLAINPREIGGALDRGCAGPLSGAGTTLCGNVLFAPSVNVLDSLSGEVFTGVQNPTFTIGEQFLDSMLAQVQRRRGLPCGGGQSAGGGSSGRSGRYAAWASGFGTLSGHRDGDTTLGSARLNASDGGAAAGGDMCLGPNLRVGFALGGASSEFTLDGRTASGNTRAGLAGTYGSWASGPFYVDLALAYGHSDFSTTRNVALNAINERATADFTGNQFASRLEAGFHMRFRGYSFIPFIGATGQVLRQNGASENAVDTANGQPGVTGLNTQAHTSYAPLPTLGASASKTFEIGETTTITPRLRVSWGYETSADRQSSGSFQALSGASFTVNGARPARSGLNLRAGVDGDLFGLIEFYAQVDSAIASGGNGFSAAAGVRMAW
jgi:outer membrane autotransporter protein